MAVATGEHSTLETSLEGVAVSTANILYWRVRKGAHLLQKWENKGKWHCKLFEATRLKDGALYKIENGKIKKAQE